MSDSEEASAKSELANVAARVAWPVALLLSVGMGVAVFHPRSTEPGASGVEVVKPGPTLVASIRDLARFEAATVVVEKVVDVQDHQTHLRGLLSADDSLLFIARGEVVVGIDFGKVAEGDITLDVKTAVATIQLPPIEVLSTKIDEVHSYVRSRDTDLLAKRNEGLEGEARKEALREFEKAGRTKEVHDRARASVERQISSLARALGAREVKITFQTANGSPSP